MASLLLVGAVAYLMYTGVQQSAVYYLTIDEFLAKKETLANEGIRVAGRVDARQRDQEDDPGGRRAELPAGRLQDRR